MAGSAAMGAGNTDEVARRLAGRWGKPVVTEIDLPDRRIRSRS
ncbi:MAG TPA: hypothetical protein VGR22_05000 [Thermomicrobiales bacterium]|nr:hypothetical protein [Thermomicrobiales bacterium]